MCAGRAAVGPGQLTPGQGACCCGMRTSQGGAHGCRAGGCHACSTATLVQVQLQRTVRTEAGRRRCGGTASRARSAPPLGPSCSICLCMSEPPTVPIVTSCRQRRSTVNGESTARWPPVRGAAALAVPAERDCSPAAPQHGRQRAGGTGRAAHLAQPLHLLHHLLLHLLHAVNTRKNVRTGLGAGDRLRHGTALLTVASLRLPAAAPRAHSCLARLRQRAIHIKQAEHPLCHGCSSPVQTETATCRRGQQQRRVNAGGSGGSAKTCSPARRRNGLLIATCNRKPPALPARPRARPASKPCCCPPETALP